jgi:hypothetical protein
MGLVTPEATTAPHRLLLELMEEISEDAYCSAWQIGLVVSLWEIVEHGQPARYGAVEVGSDLIARLRRLSDAAGGWWAWSDEFAEAVFVPSEAWRRTLKARES